MNKKKSKDFIGVFDSGVGGLSILKQLIKDFPKETFVYLGDTARLPYGAKSKETIKNYVLKNIEYLNKNYSLKAVVVACNSASSVLNEVSLPVKSIGVIEAGALAALKNTSTNHIGLWATRATTFSKAYEKYILSSENKNTKVSSVACPSLVTLVEEGLAPHPLLLPAFDFYLSQFKNLEEIDTLILGCTHFPFFKEELNTYLKNKNLKIKLTDASEEISLQLKSLIADKTASEKSFSDQILVTDDASHFKDFVSQNLSEHRAFEFQKIDL
jgi:glutamate racemase